LGMPSQDMKMPPWYFRDVWESCQETCSRSYAYR
jgi:hypothetical protein